MNSSFPNSIFDQQVGFDQRALNIFKFQSEHVAVYKKYLAQLNLLPHTITSISQIPFLPVELFKSNKITADQEFLPGGSTRQMIFKSSGTTGAVTSSHYVGDLDIYDQSVLSGFEIFYGDIEACCLLALLPGYLERTNSSLIYMTDLLIRKTQNPLSGFFLDEFENLLSTIELLIAQKQKFILLGVTYALLDFAEFVQAKQGRMMLDESRGILMETGGMKGKRKEMVREEVHQYLKNIFGLSNIHSEYGMTELLSQAYSKGGGIFQTPPWMRILIRDASDPFSFCKDGVTGGINVIDLANIHSCAFIATQDLGKKSNDGSFEVLGRFDQSDLRGCNLMIE